MTGHDDAHEQYDRVARASAAQVIAGYSTSFGRASRLLAEPVRSHVRCLYALVRVADEIVDAPDPDFPLALRARLLDDLEAETERALDHGHSANLVVHAFALTARVHGIGTELTRPFFASMRTDLSRQRHDRDSLEQYVYGSAEVVGLMCLRVFVAGDGAAYAQLAPGARHLGSAFQRVNFLRDLGEDQNQLGRIYLPGSDPQQFDDRRRDALLDEIDAELEIAAVAIAQLPPSSCRAVSAAHGLYAALSQRLRRTPAGEILRHRVRVPDAQKVLIIARAIAGRHP